MAKLGKKKKEEKTEGMTPEQVEAQERLAVFENEYKELCIRHGISHSYAPRWVRRDDGSYSMVINLEYTAIDKNGNIKQ